MWPVLRRPRGSTQTATLIRRWEVCIGHYILPLGNVELHCPSSRGLFHSVPQLLSAFVAFLVPSIPSSSSNSILALLLGLGLLLGAILGILVRALGLVSLVIIWSSRIVTVAIAPHLVRVIRRVRQGIVRVILGLVGVRGKLGIGRRRYWRRGWGRGLFRGGGALRRRLWDSRGWRLRLRGVTGRLLFKHRNRRWLSRGSCRSLVCSRNTILALRITASIRIHGVVIVVRIWVSGILLLILLVPLIVLLLMLLLLLLLLLLKGSGISHRSLILASRCRAMTGL